MSDEEKRAALEGRDLGLYALCVLIWGSTWLAITFQLGVVPPSVSVFWRFSLGAALLLVYAAYKKLDLRFSVAEHIWIALQGEQVAPRFTFGDAEINAYGVKELGVLEDVLRRKDEETLAAVASRIRTKIKRHRPSGESDEEFLEAYYLALRKRLEGRLLFGHRRRDKFDTP